MKNKKLFPFNSCKQQSNRSVLVECVQWHSFLKSSHKDNSMNCIVVNVTLILLSNNTEFTWKADSLGVSYILCCAVFVVLSQLR